MNCPETSLLRRASIVPGEQVYTLSTWYIPTDTVFRASVTMKLAKLASRGKDIADLDTLEGLEGGPVVAPGLVEPSRTEVPVLVSYETHLRRIDAIEGQQIEGQQIVEGQHQPLRLVEAHRVM